MLQSNLSSEKVKINFQFENILSYKHTQKNQNFQKILLIKSTMQMTFYKKLLIRIEVIDPSRKKKKDLIMNLLT